MKEEDLKKETENSNLNNEIADNSNTKFNKGNIENSEEKSNKTKSKKTDLNSHEVKSNKEKDNKPKEVKLPFWKRVKTSIFDFDKYYIVAGESASKSVGYLFKLLAIFALVFAIVFTYKMSTIIVDSCNYLKNNVPDFRVENNEFSIDSEEPITIVNNTYVPLKIVFDNTEDYEKYDNLDSVLSDGYTVIFTKNKVIAKSPESNLMTGDYQNVLKQIGKDSINKEEIISLAKNNSNVYSSLFISVFILMFITYGIVLFFNVLALSLLAWVIIGMMKLPLKYYSAFSISASAITLPVILNIVYIVFNILTGFNMEYFNVMYTIISFIYVFAAIIMLRSTLIKNNDKINEEIKKRIKESKNKNDNDESTAEIKENESNDND